MFKNIVYIILAGLILIPLQNHAQCVEYNSTNYSGGDLSSSDCISLVPPFSTAAGANFSIIVGTQEEPIYSASYVAPALTDMNYVMETSYTLASTTETITKVGDKIHSVNYFDGLGRSLQGVQVMASPTGHDIVQAYRYDEFGRQSQNYLPYSTYGTIYNTQPGRYRSGAYSTAGSGQSNDDLTLFYTDYGTYTNPQDVANTSYPFAETIYENSPLNRVMEQGAPGETWQPADNSGSSNGHTVKYTYLSNSAYEVYRLGLNEDMDIINTVYQPTGSSHLYYASNELYENITTDENGYEQKEFTDKQGRLILKVNAEQGMTYYIYDAFSLLRYVLPPKFSDQIADFAYINIEIPRDNQQVSDLCYYYEYDRRKRMIEKKLPGVDPVYMVYDKRDRLIATQDGNMRTGTAELAANSWLFTRYDQFNRPIMTGTFVYNDGDTDPANNQEKLQEHYNNGTYALFDTRNGANLDNYTDNGFPSSTDGARNYFSFVFYDTYPLNLDQDLYNIIAPTDEGFSENMVNWKTKGLTTTSRIKVMETGDWITNVSYYDKYGRVLTSWSDNAYSNSEDIVYNAYDFTGKVLLTQHIQTADLGDGEITTTEWNRYTYDHMGRLSITEHTINDNPVDFVKIARNEYNELGQLVDKKLHNAGSGYGQSVDYRYNIRGWLTNINNIGLVNDGNLTNDDDNDLFGMQLTYEKAEGELSSLSTYYPPFRLLYNGNIAAMAFAYAGGESRGYCFLYDNLNRLTNATGIIDLGNYWATSGHFRTSYLYDLNGNIEQLQRANASGANIDNLAYNYKGNQLIGIHDSTNNPDGYNGSMSMGDNSIPALPGTWEFSYDKNGNMRQDLNTGILNIIYNYLNLPKNLFLDTESITAQIYYTYDATGNKLKYTFGNTLERVYISNFVYEEGSLKYILTPEGKIDFFPDGSYKYEYHLKDHLGNTRVAFYGDDPATPTQATEYYPFGMIAHQTAASTDNKYLYNGKELQEGTDWYDYGARMYDASLGRFHSIDPLGELIPGINPYHYCYNNPVALTDPTGMLPGYEPNFIAATFVDPSGKIIKVTDDDDPNIYLVHDPDNWDGKSKDGLLIIGQTPEDNTLKDHVGQKINSEAVINFIFNEADRLGKQEDTWMSWIGLAHLNEFAQLMRSKEEQLKLLAEMKNLEKKRAMILLQMLKNNELMLSDIQRGQKGFTDWLAGRIITRTLLGLYGSINLPGDEAAGYLRPESILDEIDREFDTKNSQIIKKYDEMMKGVQNR